MNTDGTGLVQLTTSGEDPIAPLDVSPDGTKIVYAGVDHLPGGYIQFGLFVVNSNGTGATKIANGDGTGMGAHFSPNGSRIAFHRNVSSFEIYTINPDGTGEVQVTATPFTRRTTRIRCGRPTATSCSCPTVRRPVRPGRSCTAWRRTGQGSSG